MGVILRRHDAPLRIPYISIYNEDIDNDEGDGLLKGDEDDMIGEENLANSRANRGFRDDESDD